MPFCFLEKTKMAVHFAQKLRTCRSALRTKSRAQAVADAALPMRARERRGVHERRGEQARASTTREAQTTRQQPREAPAGAAPSEKQREKHPTRKQTRQQRAHRRGQEGATATRTAIAARVCWATTKFKRQDAKTKPNQCGNESRTGQR